MRIHTNTSDVLNLVLLATASTGILAAFRQLYISNKQKRADLMLQLCNKFYQDADMQEIYYKIKYGKFKYSLKSFHCSEDEQKLDKLLGLLSYIGHLYQTGIIGKKELAMIKYEFQTVYEYEDIKAYFKTLDTWFQSRMITHLKFQSFREVGKILTVAI